ncbi:MAG: hypothetical protein U0401_14640 [Anaerolineae bacterium]
MVIAFGIAPQNWPPSSAAIADLAQSLQLAPDKLNQVFGLVTSLTSAQQKQVLLTIQRIADILAHIVGERCLLLDCLDTIAKLSVPLIFRPSSHAALDQVLPQEETGYESHR